MNSSTADPRPAADFARCPVDLCVLAFSSDHTPHLDHFDMIDECLGRLEEHTDPALYRLHVGCNNLSPRAMARVEALCKRLHGHVHVGQPHRDAGRREVFPKYPLMDTMYRAGDAPWVIWLDDDSMIDAPDWLEALQAKVNDTPQADQFGKTANVPWIDRDHDWVARASWHNPSIELPRTPIGDGTTRIVCPYIVGGFYAVSRRAIGACAIPDPRLFHTGGDSATGLALRFRGFGIAHHTYGVRINSCARRGMHEDRWQPPGMAGHLQSTEIDRAMDMCSRL
jgi:hypothetical protein